MWTAKTLIKLRESNAGFSLLWAHISGPEVIELFLCSTQLNSWHFHTLLAEKFRAQQCLAGKNLHLLAV